MPLSASPPFCSRENKIMSSSEQINGHIETDNGAEYAYITAPVSLAGEKGELLQHAFVQQITGEHEGLDNHGQHVLMLQPITVSQEQPDGETVQQTQFILQDPGGGDPTIQQVQMVDGQQIQFHQVVHPLSLEEQQQLHDQGVTQPVIQIQEQLSGESMPQGLQVLTHQDMGEVFIQELQLPSHQLQQVHQVQLQDLQQQMPVVETPAPSFLLPSQLIKKPPGRPKQEIKPPVGKGPYECEKCPKIFPRWAQLQRHLKLHEDDKPFRCEKCPETFNVETNLILHAATHQTENPVCPECGKSFSRVASLKAHIMLHEREESLICTECGDEFNVQSQLDRHLAEHREEESGSRSYPCKHCNLLFGKLSLLRDHIKQHYRIKSSLSHRTYKRNIDRTGFSYKCTHCQKTFQKPSQLERHIRIHTGERPYVCHICEKAFNQKGALQIHMSRHTGSKPHSCQFCPMTFIQRGNLRAHIQRVHTHPKDGDAPLFRCEECSCVFRKLGSLNAHISRAHIEPANDIGMVVIKQEKAANNNQDGAVNLDDTITELTTKSGQVVKGKNVNDVIQQLLQMSEQVSDGTRVTNSDILQQALADSGLVSGKQDRAPVQNEPIPACVVAGAGQDPMQDQSSIVCQIPSDILIQEAMNESLETPAVQNMLVDHQAVIQAQRKRGYVSTTSIHDAATGTFKKHVIRKINGIRWHQCTSCSKEFKKPSDLVRHMRIHSHEKPYKCTQCFRAFAVKSTLTAHLKTHTGVKEHTCGMCYKHFSTQGSLKVHTRLHTGAKPFECSQCGKKFRTSGHCKSHLQSHYKDASERKPRRMIKKIPKSDIPLPDIPLQEPILITDTGLIQQPPKTNTFQEAFLGDTSSLDRPYKCGFCTRGFKKSSHLKQHIRSHTGEKPYKCVQCMKAFVSSGVLKAHLRTHTGVKSYRCVLCATSFTTNGSLKRHMSTHSEVRPFMCPYCQKQFKTSVNCKKHMKTHRQELAMQALQQQQQDHQNTIQSQLPDNEIIIPQDGHVQDQEVEEDVDDVHDVPNEVIHVTANELHNLVVASGHGLGEAAVGQLVQQHVVDENGELVGQENQAAAMVLQQQELVTCSSQSELQHVVLAQQSSVLNDSLAGDVNIHNAVNPQQVFGQTQQQQQFSQSLLPQATLEHINLQGAHIETHDGQIHAMLDESGLTLATPTSVANSIVTANLDSVLNTSDPVTIPEGALIQEDGVLIAHLSGDSDRRNFVCPHCDKSYKKSSHLKQHIRSHTGEKPFQCAQCSKTFASAGVLRSHWKTHQGMKEHECKVCDAKFTTNGSLTRHMVTHKAYVCPHCPQAFNNLPVYRRHLKTHALVDSSIDINVVNTAVTQVEPEKDEKNDRIVIASTKAEVLRITEEEAEELSKTNPHTNMSLSERLLIESALEKDRTSETKEEVLKKAVSTKHAHSCEICTKSFKKPSDLVRHMRIHTGEKPYQCDKCDRAFTVKSTLESHIKTHQPSDKPFRCHICDSSFSTKGSMKVHMRLHTGAKPFKCPHCDLRFRTSGHRKCHVAQHFKSESPKKRLPRKINYEEREVALSQPVENLLPEGTIAIGQDGLQLQQQPGMMPMSVNLADILGGELQQGVQFVDSNTGIQLQLAGHVGGQGIQIQGLDSNLLTQTVQIDANLLQQLQQQGANNISLTINPNMLAQMQQPAEQQHQNMLVQQATSQGQDEASNIVIHTLPNGQSVAIEGGGDMTQAMPIISLDPNSMAALAESQVVEVPVSHGLESEELIIASGAEAIQSSASMVTIAREMDQPGLDQQSMDSMIQPTVIEPSIVQPSMIQPINVQESLGDHTNLDDLETNGIEEEQDGQVAHDEHTLKNSMGLTENQQAIHILRLEEGTAELPLEQTDLTTSPENTPSHPERKFFCNFCNKGFKRSCHLKDHLATHTPGLRTPQPKSTPHRCDTCDKCFSKPSLLERHVRIHTGDRPFRCGECGRAFNQKNALLMHQKGKHTLEKPHQCPYCSQAFTQKGNLKTHVKRVHHYEMVESMQLDMSAGESMLDCSVNDLFSTSREANGGGAVPTSTATDTVLQQQGTTTVVMQGYADGTTGEVQEVNQACLPTFTVTPGTAGGVLTTADGEQVHVPDFTITDSVMEGTT